MTVPSPPAIAQEFSAEIQCPASLTSGRRERRVEICRVSFSDLTMRVGASVEIGSWVELQLAPPFPSTSWVGGIVRACSASEDAAAAGRTEYRVDVDLHAVGEEYFNSTNTILAMAEQKRELRVMVVDSDPLSRSSVAGLLRGYAQGVEAESCADLFAQLQASPNRPDAMILAANVGDAEGIEVARELYDSGWTVPAIILTPKYRQDLPRAGKLLAGYPFAMMEIPAGREKLRAELSELIPVGRSARRSAARAQARVELYGRLSDSYRRLRKAAGGYLDTRILDRTTDEASEHAEGRTREISILFVDIRGSTKLIDQLPPEEAVTIVNRVLTELAEAVETHGGMVDKFLGDGLMGLFGATEDDPHHRHRALSSGRSMVHRIAALNKSGKLPGAIQVGIGVGIQSGSAILGNVGSEFRKEFTALGAPVNVAARLQALAGPGEVVVHGRFAQDLEDVARFESIGRHELKGFAEPVEVFRLVD